MPAPKNEFVHPAYRQSSGYQAAVAEELRQQPEAVSFAECRRAGPSDHAAGTGPGDTHAEARSSRREVTAQTLDPRKAAYDALVSHFVTKAPVEGYERIAQMPPLSGLQRGVILEACPDVMNDFVFEPLEIACVLRGEIDPGTWLSASTENALRQWLLDAVNEEIAKDAEILRQSAFDPEEPVL